MIIQPQCLPGARRNPHGWLPRHAWPDNCAVQWGSSGLVFCDDASYRTAFFEAFPIDTFLRGEGATIEAAEEHAWRQFVKIQSCPGHDMERRGYTNGAGFCRHCPLFQARAFPPIAEADAKPGLLERAFQGEPDALHQLLNHLGDTPPE